MGRQIGAIRREPQSPVLRETGVAAAAGRGGGVTQRLGTLILLFVLTAALQPEPDGRRSSLGDQRSWEGEQGGLFASRRV